MSDLDAASIASAIAASGGAARPVVVASSTLSTNDDAKVAASTGAPDGAAFLAEMQTAGRGRGGHTWHSPASENLYLSVVVRPRVPAASIASITLAIGVAVADVLAARIGARAAVAVKWPNDVLAGGRKLAGVLVEGQLRGADVSSLIVGLGVNVHATEFPPELAARATSLALLGVGDRDRDRSAQAGEWGARLIPSPKGMSTWRSSSALAVKTPFKLGRVVGTSSSILAARRRRRSTAKSR